MSVREYEEYEHGGGFVGFRVARTIGDAKVYRQKYFSLNEYSYTTAKRLAHKLDKEWRKEADEIRLLSIREPYRRKVLRENMIDDGLRACIEVSNKVRATETHTYFIPCFIVNVPRGKGCLTFRTAKLGYKKAFIDAAKKHSELYELSKKESAAILKKMPDIDLFTGYLLKGVRARGFKVSKNRIIELLNEKGNVKEVVKPKAKPAVKAKTKPAVKAKAKPAVKAKTKPAVKAKAKPAVKAKTKPVVKAKAKPAVKAKTKPVAKTKTKPKTKPKAKPKATTKAKTKAKSKIKSKAK